MSRQAAIPRESDLDRRNEAEIVTEVAREWMTEWQKMPAKYSRDYALPRNGLVAAYLEVKNRDSWKGYDTYMLSLYKFNRALELSAASGRNCYFAARLGGDIMWTCLNELPESVRENVQIGGWANPRDDDDIEPVLHIPISYFRALEGSGGKALPSINSKEQAA